jgi:hypothetical protein
MEAPRFHLSLQTDLSSGCAACEVCRNQASCDAFKLRKEMPDDTVGLPVELQLVAPSALFRIRLLCLPCLELTVVGSHLRLAVCNEPATDLNVWSICWTRTRAVRV